MMSLLICFCLWEGKTETHINNHFMVSISFTTNSKPIENKKHIRTCEFKKQML